MARNNLCLLLCLPLALSACGASNYYAGLDLRAGRLPDDLRDLALRAKAGDVAAATALARRLETSDGSPQNVRSAKLIYATLESRNMRWNSFRRGSGVAAPIPTIGGSSPRMATAQRSSAAGTTSSGRLERTVKFLILDPVPDDAAVDICPVLRADFSQLFKPAMTDWCLSTAFVDRRSRQTYYSLNYSDSETESPTYLEDHPDSKYSPEYSYFLPSKEISTGRFTFVEFSRPGQPAIRIVVGKAK